MILRSRWVNARIQQVLAAFRAVMATGARAVGKTTTAEQFSAETVRLDSPREGAVFAGDPDAALIGLKAPSLLDELQAVPEGLGPVKRSVYRNRGVGRYILTGSAYREAGVTEWAGTGRVITVPMAPMIQAEARASSADGLAHALRNPMMSILTDEHVVSSHPSQGADLLEVLACALRSGFPGAMELSEPDRRLWIEAYVSDLAQRDPINVGERVDTVLLRR